MVGELRLTAHGSAGTVALVGAAAVPDVAPGVAGAVIEAIGAVVGAGGVLATVESPDPQPVNVAVNSQTEQRPVDSRARLSGDHTSRTVPLSHPGVRQARPASRAPGAEPDH